MDTEYYVFIHKPGPNWLRGKPVNEQPLSGHFEYMTKLEHENVLVLGGGFTDNSGAMGILRARNIAEAEKTVNADPAVQEGIVVTEVHPYYITVVGEIVKS